MNMKKLSPDMVASIALHARRNETMHDAQAIMDTLLMMGITDYEDMDLDAFWMILPDVLPLVWAYIVGMFPTHDGHTYNPRTGRSITGGFRYNDDFFELWACNGRGERISKGLIPDDYEAAALWLLGQYCRG